MVKRKTLIILGSSSGIARELIKKLKYKYKIISFYNNNKVKINKVVSYKLNFNSKDDEIESKFKKIIEKNSKFIILNFASIKIDKISYYINKGEIEKTFNINTFAFLRIIQEFIPKMLREKWGRVINISSVGGLKGDKGTLLYSSSKNASASMMNVMSQEYGKFNMTFNTLKLGNFNYGLFKKLNPNIKKNIINKIPSKKTGKIINIINAIEFLIESDYVNGSSISIDGGMN